MAPGELRPEVRGQSSVRVIDRARVCMCVDANVHHGPDIRVVSNQEDGDMNPEQNKDEAL